MNRLIYVETSIPSFYFETRTGTQLQARREWTREWWEIAKWQDALVTSPVVVTEIEETPDAVKKTEMLNLIESLPRLAYADEIDAIVEVYFRNKLMPLDSGGDAHHLALASFHRCDILLTWNCKHLANGNKTGAHSPHQQHARPAHTADYHAARTHRIRTMNTEPQTPAHDDGLEWLRDIRRKMFTEAGGDLKKLGDRYRATQSQHPEKTFDPHDVVIKAVKERRG